MHYSSAASLLPGDRKGTISVCTEGACNKELQSLHCGQSQKGSGCHLQPSTTESSSSSALGAAEYRYRWYKTIHDVFKHVRGKVSHHVPSQVQGTQSPALSVGLGSLRKVNDEIRLLAKTCWWLQSGRD